MITVFGRSGTIELLPSQIEPYYDGGTSDSEQRESPSDPDVSLAGLAPAAEIRRSASSSLKPSNPRTDRYVWLRLWLYRTGWFIGRGTAGL